MLMGTVPVFLTTSSVVAGIPPTESNGPYTLQGRLVKVVGQLVPLGKNKENWMAEVEIGFSVAVEEDVGVGEKFLGYLAVPLT